MFPREKLLQRKKLFWRVRPYNKACGSERKSDWLWWAVIQAILASYPRSACGPRDPHCVQVEWWKLLALWSSGKTAVPPPRPILNTACQRKEHSPDGFSRASLTAYQFKESSGNIMAPFAGMSLKSRRGSCLQSPGSIHFHSQVDEAKHKEEQ